MSPDQIPQKEGEPASEIVAGAIQTLKLWGYEPGSNIAGVAAILERARVRAVAQEAEGRRLREACTPWLEAQFGSYFANKLETLPDSYPVASNITLGDLRRLRAALSGSSETP